MRVLNRIADALEKLASDPQVEIEFGEPLCPHCGTVDPEIVTEASEGRGRLSEFIITGVCCSCNQVLYGLCESYSMHHSTETLKAQIEERRVFFNANNGNA